MFPDPGSSKNHADLIAAARQQFESARRSHRKSAHLDDRRADRFGRGVHPIDAIRGYEILREIHRGGQGVVYQAVQTSTRRTVAIKVLREGPFAGEQDRSRFERETAILAQLSHPHIVGIIDRGVESGCYYFIMDYVDGVSLERYAESEGLDVTARLRLFAEVCEAVNFAHLRGIIHRDLKPGNILIDSHGRPRILDFGLAKSTDGTLASAEGHTLTGQFVGSLPWASPEQVQGDAVQIDTRTDVYSLGVVLYHLITGAFPYPVVGSMRDVLDHIIRTEPPAPSTVVGRGAITSASGRPEAIDRDLDAIILKCLSKDRNGRYQTAGELARDLGRFLAGTAVEARKLTTLYVLGKSIRRHRIAVAFATSIMLVVAAGTVTSLVLWRQAVTQRDRALAAESDVRRQAALARAETQKAQAVTGFLQTMLSSADPEASSGRAVTVLELLDDAAANLDDQGMNHTPEVEAEIRATLGRTYLSLGRQADAESHLALALRIFRSLPGDHRLAIATTLRDLAKLRANAGKRAEAEPLVREAVAILRTLPAGADAALDECLQLIYDLRLERNHSDEEMDLLREILAIRTRLYGDAHPQVARVLSAMALRMSDRAEALTLAQSAAEMARRALGSHHPEYARMLVGVADLLFMNKRIDEAEQTYLAALALMKEIYGPAHPEMSRCLSDLMFLYSVTDRQDKWLRVTAESVDISTALYGRRSPHTAALLVELGMAKRRTGDDAGAEAALRESLDMLVEFDEEHVQMAKARVNLAEILLARGEIDEAETLASACEGMSQSQLGPDHWGRGAARIILGRIFATRRQFDEAEDWLLSGYEVLEKSRVAQQRVRAAARYLARFYDEWQGAADVDKSAETATWIERAERTEQGTPFGTRAGSE